MAAVLSANDSAGDTNLNSSQKSSRRRACNECKQQKLRCNLTAENNGSSICRCQKLGLECKLEHNFRRTRKRRLEELKRKLAAYETNGQDLRMPSTLAYPCGSQPASQDNDMASAVEVSPQQPTRMLAAQSETSYTRIERSYAPGVTTKPIIDVNQSRSSTLLFSPQPRKLDDVELSYFRHYHPFLPFLRPERSPHSYCESSPLLFWSIVSVVSQRSESQATLLPRLARAVTDLLWSTLRSIPYSIHSVQSLMGLHCATGAEDFTKIPLKLSTGEYEEWGATWIACNVAAHSVSIGCGLPAPVMLHDRPLYTETLQPDMTLWMHLRIEQYRHRVSVALSPHTLRTSNYSSSRDRISLYRLLDAVHGDLEREVMLTSHSTLNRVYLWAAHLHLHSFYLLDDPSTDGYTDRIAILYQTASAFVSQTLDMDSQDGRLLHYWPFFCYQAFVAASCTLLKIIKNGSFDSIVDVRTGRALLNSAILALREMSFINNDLPARLSDVLAFLYSLPANTAGQRDTTPSLRLRVRNRFSMSVVYDLLWEWRKHFSSHPELGQNTSDKCQKPIVCWAID
ncbi:hypothetical protein BDV06DRAFT_213894 [Aspergillus oleicola]